jgi:hypothetical protein
MCLGGVFAIVDLSVCGETKHLRIFVRRDDATVFVMPSRVAIV